MAFVGVGGDGDGAGGGWDDNLAGLLFWDLGDDC